MSLLPVLTTKFGLYKATTYFKSRKLLFQKRSKREQKFRLFFKPTINGIQIAAKAKNNYRILFRL